MSILLTLRVKLVSKDSLVVSCFSANKSVNYKKPMHIRSRQFKCMC
uniref:Uncharacterized protein n=1 Tax=Arundo donax TaxID=35708 RepID=A0A0A9B075_ARUDO